jgi:hypothetical protein
MQVAVIIILYNGYGFDLVDLLCLMPLSICNKFHDYFMYFPLFKGFLSVSII